MKINLMKIYILCTLLFLAVPVLLLPGCSQRKVAQKYNVLLISIDTCRADHLSCYGYQHNTTPNIDKIAEEGILFKNVFATIPLTLPSHCSMLTGTIPPYHGVHNNENYRLAESHLTLAEILSANGYETASIISAFVLDNKFGTAQGFDYYNDDIEEKSGSDSAAERRADESSRLAMEWLEQRDKDKNFFFFLHYYDPHTLYDPPEPFDQSFDDPYDGEIAFTDHWINKVIEKLKNLQLYDSTLIIITSDHGEGLGDHDEDTHGFLIYNSTIKVPLIFKLPQNNPPNVFDDFAGTVDIAPTILDYLGIPVPDEMHGSSLVPYFSKMKHPLDGRYYYCESIIPSIFNCNTLSGLVHDRWKYIKTTRDELYDLSNDPKEENNLLQQKPGLAQKYNIILDEIILQSASSAEEETTLQLSKKDKDRLMALGYFGGSSDISHEIDKSREDPKDFARYHNLFVRAFNLCAEERFNEAKTLCFEIINEREDFPKAYTMLGNLFLDEGSSEKAIEYFGKALELSPGNVAAHQDLANALETLGKYDEALKEYGKVIELDPGNPSYQCNYAKLLISKGELSMASRYLQKALELNPEFDEAHSNLGIILLKQGKPKEAMDYFLKVIDLNANHEEAYYNIGFIWNKLGNPAEAQKYFLKAIKINPEFRDAHYNLGILSAKQSNFLNAINYFKKVIDLQPDYTDAHFSIARCYSITGDTLGAVDHYRKVLQINPDHLDSSIKLAFILATTENDTIRNSEEAIKLSEMVCRKTGNINPNALDTLAAAYAEAGRFKDAVKTARQAITAAHSMNNKRVAEDIQKRLVLYENNKPFRTD